MHKKGDVDSFQVKSNVFLQLISDMDKLLATQKDFVLGNWLNNARRWGTTVEEKNLYEKNAHNLITLWGDKNSTLRECSCRQWSGLLNGFYKKRWEQFFAYVIEQMKSRQPVEEKTFDNRIKEWEWNCVNNHEANSDKPKENAVSIAKEMYSKYKDII